MRTLLAVILLALSGCAATQTAVMRRQAGYQLRACLGYHPPYTLPRWGPGYENLKKRCIAESAAWCQAHGLDRDCGVDVVFY